ncbi:PPC domain-containing DNA-binding protein [candidate division KSB1 bacterium]
MFIFLACGAIYLIVSSKPVTSGMSDDKIYKVPLSEKYFKGAKVKEIYRLRLDPGDLLLESIQELIDREGIKDGAITSGTGTLKECRMHWITTTTFPVNLQINVIKAPLEISSISGIIADGKPHPHMTVSDNKKAIAGHLENGCIVAYHSEVVIESYEGLALTRRPSGYGTQQMLQRK